MSITELQSLEIERLIALGYSDFIIASETKADHESVKRVRNGSSLDVKKTARSGAREESTRYWICPKCQSRLKMGNNVLSNDSCLACDARASIRARDNRFSTAECEIGDVDLRGDGLPEGAWDRYQQVRTLALAGMNDE